MLTKNDSTSIVVESWLADFEPALVALNDAGLRALFPPDRNWRDVLAVTWTIQTLGGQRRGGERTEAVGGPCPSEGFSDR